jgi:hypothetical protein
MYLEIRERNCSSGLWVRVTKVELLVEEIELGDRARSRSRLMTSSSPFPRRNHVKATDKRRFDPSILRDSVAHHISLLRCYVATLLRCYVATELQSYRATELQATDLYASRSHAIVCRTSLIRQTKAIGTMSHNTPTQGNINHSMRTNYNEFGVDEVSS